MSECFTNKIEKLFIFAVHSALVAELVDALDSKSSSFGSVGSIPTQGTDKAQKGANSSKLKKRACFFLERSEVFDFVLFKMSAVGTLAKPKNPAASFVGNNAEGIESHRAGLLSEILPKTKDLSRKLRACYV